MVAQLESWIFYFNEHEDEDEILEVPEDLTGTDDAALANFETELLSTFNAIRDASKDQVSTDSVSELSTIAAAVSRVRAESSRRKEERGRLNAEVEALAATLESPEDKPEDKPAEEPEPVVTAAVEEPAPASPAVPAQPAATPVANPAVAAALAPTAAGQGGGALVIRKPKLNVPLSEVRRLAPDPAMGVGNGSNAMVIAAPDVPNYVAGRTIDNIDFLADAMHRRAKTLANPSGTATVATIRREFDIVLDRETPPEAIWDIMKKSADPKNLVAAGGWCAPSTIIYDFFNIACDDGILDVPTVGVTRGGIRFPTSPSIADALDDIWLWTEGDDIAAATGAGTKPCVRVPCPSFNEERLDCHGLCITAGNLTESAYPELIRNYLSLVMAAHRHVINQRIIADIVANSTAVTVTGTDVPITTGLLGAVGLQAADYRERYRMCDTDVLEVVLPRWTKEAIRSDIAKRTGQDMLAVSDGQMMDWFDQRLVRVQFVTDWQVGSSDFPGQSSARTSWPAAVQFLIYAAGTFVVGNGLDLDLGVVRDSTLNAKNDHTAAWTEECKLVAKIGHESRLVTVDYAVDGRTGSANIAGLAYV